MNESIIKISEKPDDKKEKESHLKAKEMLRKYLKKYRCLLYFGFFLSIFGLTGQLLTPLIIGKVIDAITDKDFDRVK